MAALSLWIAIRIVFTTILLARRKLILVNIDDLCVLAALIVRIKYLIADVGLVSVHAIHSLILLDKLTVHYQHKDCYYDFQGQRNAERQPHRRFSGITERVHAKRGANSGWNLGLPVNLNGISVSFLLWRVNNPVVVNKIIDVCGDGIPPHSFMLV
jgi:hypothetical protein